MDIPAGKLLRLKKIILEDDFLVDEISPAVKVFKEFQATNITIWNVGLVVQELLHVRNRHPWNIVNLKELELGLLKL